MPRRITPSLAEALTEYQAIRATYVAKSTHQNDWSLLRKFVREVGEDRQVHLVTASDVENWFIQPVGKQLAPSYNKIRMRVRGFFEFCRVRGWLTGDPMGMVRNQKVMKKERLRLSPAELLELPGYAPTIRDKALITLAANTALRGNEISSIQIKDVDLANGNLHVKITKSGFEDTMGISAELDSVLREWFQEYQRLTGHNLEPDWYLFPARAAGRGHFANKKGHYGGVYLGHVYGTLIPERPIVKPWTIVQKR